MAISSAKVKTSWLGDGGASGMERAFSVADAVAPDPGDSVTLRNGRLPSATASVTRRRPPSTACVKVPQAGAADQKQENLTTPILSRGAWSEIGRAHV